MATIEHVSGTAFVVAEFRAEENTEPVPLYVDPIVELFLNDDSKRAAGRVAEDFPPVKDLVKIRTKYFDDTLERHLLSNVRQVVILDLASTLARYARQCPASPTTRSMIPRR